MIKAINFYGSNELAKVSVEKILNNAGLTNEELDIYVLKEGFGWYLKDIGKYIGDKYRGKPYSEGIIRYRLKKIRIKLDNYLDNMQVYEK